MAKDDTPIDWASGKLSQPQQSSTAADAEPDWESGTITPPPGPRGFSGVARDIGAWALKGAVGVPEAIVGLADIPTGGRVGKFLENEGGAFGFRPKQAREAINEWHSDATKDAQRKFQEADGIGGKTLAAIENPSNIAGAVIESLPLMGAGAMPARGLLAATRLGQAGAKGAAAAGAIGEGLVGAGSAAEQIRQETKDGLLTPEQAALAGAVGVTTAGFGALGGRVANRLGIGDADTLLAQGIKGLDDQVAAARAAGNNAAAQSLAKSLPRKVIEGAISEGLLEELPQSVSEQVIQNLALDKPWHEDLDASIVLGTLSGGAMGAGAAGYRGFSAPRNRGTPDDPGAPQQTPPATPPTAPPLLGNTPDPLISFPDGTVGRRADVDAYLNGLPENERMAARARLFGINPQPGGQPAPMKPSEAMGLNPATGPLSAGAAVAVDTGVAGGLQQAAAQAQADQQAQASQRTDFPMLEYADLRDDDRAAYDSYFNSVSEQTDDHLAAAISDGDIPDFGDESNVSEVEFLRRMGASEQEILDAIEAASTAGGPQAGARGAAETQTDVADSARPVAGADSQPGASQESSQALTAAERAALQADLDAEQEGGVPGARGADQAFAQVTEDAGAVPADVLQNSQKSNTSQGRVPRGDTTTAVPQPTSQPQGEPSGTQAQETQQAGAGQPQAGAAPAAAAGLTDGAPTANTGAQAAPASGQKTQEIDNAQSSTAKALIRLAGMKGSRLIADDGRGRKLFEVKVTPEFRNRHFVNGRMPMVDGLELKEKSAVTGNAYDDGYILIDNREQLAARRAATAGAQAAPAAGARDESHLNALELRLSHERGRLRAAKTDAERATRQVTVDGIEREIAGERKFLGLAPQAASAMSDDALMQALKPDGAEKTSTAQPPLSGTISPQPQAAGPALAAPEFTTIKTVHGDSVTVRTSDLQGDAPRLRQYTKDGKSKAVPAIHRDNLDLTGDKRKASAKEDADNPFFNVITTKDGSTFASQAAASRELNRLAMGETHEVVAASEVQDGAQGFVIRRKPVDAMAGRAETGGQQPAAPAAAELTLDEQLKQVNDQLANQGQVKNANTRAKRDQVRTAIAERDFPAILKAVDGDIDSAEAINQALQFAGDEPKAKVIERVLKNRGISSEYRKLWAERLLGSEGAQSAEPAPPADAAPAAETKPATVVVPPTIAAALDADMQAQKARITRLRNAATAEGMSLEEKKQAQTQLKGAELTLQTMRRTRFDAEDAAIKAIEQKDMAPFAEHITFFKTEKALQELIGAAKPQAAAPATKKKPSADQTRAKADLMAALADLGDILGKNTRMNIMPEQEQKLLPVLTRVLDAAFRLGYHKFKDSAKFALDQIRAHLGDEAADALTLDHMQGAYIAMAGGKEGADTKRAVIDVESKAEIEAHEAKTDDEAQEDAAAAPDAKTLTESLYQAIGAGNMPKDNPALKKLVETFDGKPADPARMKQAQEELETAIAMSARDIVAKGQNDKATFDELLRLYESQPSLNIRTSTSVANQAYSTPAPLAFIASRLAGITRNTVAHEPTGGTGMLLIGADPKKALVNEINDLRISALQAQGFAPTQLDASTMRLVPEGTRPDAVVTNPPFGSIKDSDGKPVKVKVDGYSIGQIDHLIAARALETMKDDGKATLILGANKVAGGLSTDDRIFFNWLYSHYNVVGHFEVDGDLYNRQGAGWPVRVITINGRQKSGKLSPVAGTIQRADNWSQVYEQFTQSLSAAAKPATVEAGGGPAVAIDAPGAPGGRRPQGSTGSAGNVAGTSPRAVPDRAKPAAEPVAPVPDEQRLNAQSFVPQPQPGQDPAGAERPAKPAGTTAVAAAPAAAGNEFQTPYVPRSVRKDEGVLIPSNMAQPTQDALNRLEDAVGDIDEFARKELGYESSEALHSALMGLQVDSVATAIYQIKQNKAVVIADQTGIGKGRQAASIIRWAARNGMIPVFVSVKPSLFTDMYGDLADIGTHDVAPFILNSTEWVSGADGEKLFANKPSAHRAAIQSIVDNAALPQGRNALFMTYSQINTANLQRQALMSLAPNAVFVLDESHNAAGDSGTGEFMISVLKEARGVTYLSATYAKRPDNMPLYFKTDIGDAAADSEGLADAMAAGGLPLQTVVSNNLVKAGQMFRRERSYDGVSIASTFDTANRQQHERLSDEATEALRAIVSADKMFHSVFVKSMDKALKAEGSKVQDNAGNQVSAGVQHTEFSSVVHNFVRQMLLGLKAQTAADEAIASLKRGEKPIIAVENTMGSFLSEYAAQNNINQGDSLGAFDYRTVLSRALERSRGINVVLPTGDKSKQNIPLSQLDPMTRKAYDQAQAVIDRLAIDIPVSPIDWMRAEIARAGFSVAEITGRDLAVDYSNPRKPVLSAIDLTEQRDKVASTRRFNGGELDALILNVAGSTGISLHASEKFADQRQRHMIVAQAAGDINIFMQMLGRVHRTGQVRLPKYTILSVDLPTEKRPTAVLSRKMKSLNANTSSNTESATSVKTADILNKYGDQIVNQYLADNIELARQLGVDDLISADGERVTDDIARKATGRLALQPIEVQRAFYEDVEAQYDALIEYLNKTNQNDLEPRTFDFDAKEVRTEILFDGPNKATPFGEDAVYGEYSIKAQGMAMKPEEIQAAIAESLQGKTGQEHARDLLNGLLQAYVEQTNAALAKKVGQGAAFDLDEYAAFLKPLFGEDGAARMMAQAQAFMANGTQVGQLTVRDLSGAQGVGAGMEFLRNHAIGKTFRVEINSEPYNGVITNVRNTHKTTGNPFSLSKFQITLAVNGALRSITVPATQFKKIEVSSIAPAFRIETLFKEQPANQRETAKIVTGNLLAAYGEIKGARGTIISFTKADGVIEQGILLPKLFDFSKNTQGDYRLRSGADALKFLQQSTNKDIGRFGISTRDGQVRVLPRGDGVQVRVPKSKAQGARYFLDKNLIAVAGDFVSSANAMVANVEEAASAEKVLDMLMDKQALYALPSMADEAKSMAAKPGADGGTASFSRAPSAIPTADSNARLVATIRAAITKAYGNLLDQLESKGLVTLTQTEDEAIEAAARARADKTGQPLAEVRASLMGSVSNSVATDDLDIRRSADGSIQGFFDPQTGQSFLVADNLTAEAAPGVLMHEVGIHMAADGSMKALFNRAAMMLKMQRGNPFIKAVQARMDAAGETSGEEAAAYIAEAYENDRANAPASVQRWLADLLAAVKAWMFKKGIMGADRLTVADIAAVARANARSMARDGGATGGQGFGTAFSRAPAGDQTQTENFRRWFAGSKVVDAEGKPLRVYHGSSRDIEIFAAGADEAGQSNGNRTGAWGSYFTPSAAEASIYAEIAGGDSPQNVVPVYLAIRNPYVMNRAEWGKHSQRTAKAATSAEGRADAKAVRAGIEALGHDGIVIRDRGFNDEWVAFRPEQIKSAIGNNGNFDPADGRIDHFGANRPAKDGTPTDRAVMDMTRDGKSAQDILRLIAGTSKSRFNRQVARLLLRTGVTPKVEALAADGLGKDKRGFNLLAKYSRDSNTISLTEGAGYMAEQIMLHELIHAATLRALDRKGLASLQMKRLFAHVQKQGVLDGTYGMKNVGEFTSEAFTNPDFQRELRKIKGMQDGSVLKTAWDSFVRILRSILGLSNDTHSALSQALELGVSVMREDMLIRKRSAKRGMSAEGGADPDAQTASALQGRVEGMSAAELVRFLAEDNTPAHAEIARRVGERMAQLQKQGVSFGFKVAHIGTFAPAAMNRARAYTEFELNDKDQISVMVWAHGADMTGRVGMDKGTLLHELVHAVTGAALQAGRTHPDSAYRTAVADLRKLHAALVEHIIARRKRLGDGISEFEKSILEGSNNAMQSEDEVLAWGLTNPEMQGLLESMPYDGATGWSKFVQTIRSLLGLDASASTGLSEVLRIADQIMSAEAVETSELPNIAKRGMPLYSTQGTARRWGMAAQQEGDDIGASQTDAFDRAAVDAANYRFWEDLRIDGIRRDLQDEYDEQGTVDGSEISHKGLDRDEYGDLTDEGFTELDRRVEAAIEAATKARAGLIENLSDIDRLGTHMQAYEAAKAWLDAAGVRYQELGSAGSRYLEVFSPEYVAGTDVEASSDSIKLRFATHGQQSRQHTQTHWSWVEQGAADNKYGNAGESLADMLDAALRFSRGEKGIGEQVHYFGTDDVARNIGDGLKSITVPNVKRLGKHKLTDWLKLGLQFLGRRQLVDIYGDMLPLAEYNRLVQKMEADKNEGGAEADKLVTRWADLPDEGKLADLMHDATLAQIDPAKPYVGGDDKAKYAMLAGRFNALSQEAKQVYTDTRDAYQAHHAKVRSAIKERIERSELKGPRKAELLKRMDDEFFAAVKGVYFPLARFGQYAVTVKGPDGKVESVSRAETKAEAEALRNNLLSAFPRDKGFTVGRVMLSKDFIADRDAVGHGFMTELYQVLDKQDMDAAQRAELEDTLGQLYLSSLPDLSWAKHGIHRKGTPGFSQDARRAYAQNMFHGARYLAKLRYSDLMQDELTAMQKHVDDWRDVEDFDQNSAQRVVDEMNKRHESLMNPKSNPLSTALTSLGFVFHLGLSPASAMVNLSQTALVAYPIMGAKWGFGKASAALLKASAEATKGKNDITGSLNADERAAYDEAVRAGTIDVTMAHDLAGIAQGEDAGVMWKIRPVMRWASFLFHHAERFNRQVTFVAAYRLAREAGADNKAAFEQATKATYDGHFDYSASNRARIMQGNVAKVLLLFKQYGQNMVYTLSRNAYQSINGTDAEKAEARKVLAGLLTSHAMAAGVLGLPMVTTLLAAASMIGGDDDEPWDAKVALQNLLADTFGQKPAEVLAHGLSRLTPWDISGRVGLDRLIFPDVQEGLEGQRLAESAMAAALGPVAGIGVNMLKGAQHMSEGRYALGLEAMLPSALRGPVKAIRYANEGVQDKSGISILDEVSPAAVAGQALGFSPSQARNAQEGKSAVMAHDRALGERRQELLTKAARATMAKDAEARAEAMKEIERFNQKNPTRRITPLNVLQSVRNRNKRIDQAQDGVYLPRNRRDAMDAGRFAFAGTD